jgi:hypothetical protein
MMALKLPIKLTFYGTKSTEDKAFLTVILCRSEVSISSRAAAKFELPESLIEQQITTAGVWVEDYP